MPLKYAYIAPRRAHNGVDAFLVTCVTYKELISSNIVA